MAAARLNPVIRYLRRIAPAAGLTDGQILERYRQQGDQAAFTALVDRHASLVLGVCRRVLGNAHDAEDAFQAVFLVLFRKAWSIGKRDSVGSWLHGVAVRIALKARAAAARRRLVERQAATNDVLEDTPNRDWQELQPVLDEEIARLPERYRRPLILCYLQGKSHAEAARQLGWPKGTVATQLTRARSRLRRRLEWRGVTLSATALAAILAQNAPAAVPCSLVSATVAIAASGAVGPAVSALAKGALMQLFITKFRSLTAGLMLLGALGAGTGVVMRWQAAAANAEQHAVTAPVAIAPAEGEQQSTMPGVAENEAKKPQRQFMFECLVTQRAADGTEKRLAEPRLVTLDGHVASFLAGGHARFPAQETSEDPPVLLIPAGTQASPAPVLAKQTSVKPPAPTDSQEKPQRPVNPAVSRLVPFGTQINIIATSLPDGWILLELSCSHSLLETDREDNGVVVKAKEGSGGQLLLGVASKTDSSDSVVIRGRTVQTLRRIKPGDTVKLEFEQAKPNERLLRLEVKVHEIDESAHP